MGYMVYIYEKPTSDFVSSIDMNAAKFAKTPIGSSAKYSKA